MAQMLGLQRSGRRSGIDATDGAGREYELKSTTGNSVGTSRDVGHDYLNRMLSRTLVVLKGQNLALGFQRQALVVVFPREIAPWVEALRDLIDRDEELMERLLDGGETLLSEAEAERVRYLGRRGATRNNPKVPWSYIAEAGVLLRDGQEAEDLQTVAIAYDEGRTLAELRALVGDERQVADLEATADAAAEATTEEP